MRHWVWQLPLASSGHAADITKAKLYPDKKGTVADFLPMSKFCGTKPIKVALSDGWGGNYWRHITRAEFEDEASKCPNITETRYTDGEFKPEKQIADIEGLIAQKFDVIVAFLDGGPAILKATREATAAGVAVVPYSTSATISPASSARTTSIASPKARARSASSLPIGWPRPSTAKAR